MSILQNSINSPIPFTVSKGGTGVANPTAHTIPVAQGALPFNFLGPLADGEVLMGVGGSDPVPGVFVEGNGISIDTAPGSITIAANGSGLKFQTVTANTAMTPNTSYIMHSTGSPSVIMTLPTIAPSGTQLIVTNFDFPTWEIHQNSGQIIIYSSQNTTFGTAGKLSGITGGSVTLICLTDNVSWIAQASVGTIVVT